MTRDSLKQPAHRSRRQRRTPLAAHHRRRACADVDLELLLDALPDDQRQAFALTPLLGYRYDEAATICDCPIGTIRLRVARIQLAATLTASEHTA